MRFLRMPTVRAKTGLSRSKIYEELKEGKFPKPVKLSDRCSAWIESEVEEWQKGKIAERNGARQ
jgi:prophage regulatory protein